MESLEKRVADRICELSMLYNVSAVSSGSLDLETTMAHALALLLPAVQCETGIIHLVEQGESQVTLRMITQKGFESKILDQLSSSLCTERLWGWVATHKRSLMIPDLMDGTRTAQMLRTCLKSSSVNVYLGVPILSKGQLAGVLSVFRYTPQQFTPEEAALLATIAGQLGVLLERDHLQQMAEQAAVTEERQRLTRDLHDSVTQALYSLTLFSEASQEYINNGQLERVQQLHERIDYTTQQGLNSVQSELQGWAQRRSSNAANSNGPRPCITLVDSPRQIRPAIEAGADTILLKGFTIAQLLEHIDRLLLQQRLLTGEQATI